MTQVTKETLAARIAALESGPVSLKEEFYLAVMKRCVELELAATTAHDTLLEINEYNYNHEDVVRLNDASVEAILTLAPVIYG